MDFRNGNLVDGGRVVVDVASLAGQLGLSRRGRLWRLVLSSLMASVSLGGAVGAHKGVCRVELPTNLVRDIRRVARRRGVGFGSLVCDVLRAGIALDMVDLEQSEAVKREKNSKFWRGGLDR